MSDLSKRKRERERERERERKRDRERQREITGVRNSLVQLCVLDGWDLLALGNEVMAQPIHVLGNMHQFMHTCTSDSHQLFLRKTEKATFHTSFRLGTCAGI